jgi:hypothetical protein
MMLPILAATVGTNFRGPNDAPVRSQYVNELSLPAVICRPQANKTNSCGRFFFFRSQASCCVNQKREEGMLAWSPRNNRWVREGLVGSRSRQWCL